MANVHVGIPKFIEKGFSLSNKVYKYDYKRGKHYYESIDTLGTEKSYYDNDVEKEILANGIECQLSLFYNKFCKTTDLELMEKIININKALIEQFFSFMFIRAKKTLNTINDSSLSSAIFGNIDHSELIRIQLAINTNPLQIIGNSYDFHPVINYSSQLFINNSLGFCLMISKTKDKSFFMPLNNKVGILVSNVEAVNGKGCLIIWQNDNHKTDIINKSICKLEIEYGNGFIFGQTKKLLSPYIEYINSIKPKS